MVTCVPFGPGAVCQVAPPSVEYWQPVVAKSTPAVAVPPEAVRSNAIGSDEGLDRLSAKATGLPSGALPLPIVTAGAASSSTIVPVPGFTADTAPLAAAPERENVSSGSSIVS